MDGSSKMASKRGWLEYVREDAKKWSKPVVRLTPTAKPAVKPAPKRRPGAVRLVTGALALVCGQSLPMQADL